MASLFYDLDSLSQVAVNLFYGWGYNFYRLENEVRADDQLLRAKACSLLGLAARQVLAAEDEFRREHLPAPTRAKPYPDPTAVVGAQRLERLGKSILSLEGLIQNQPVPEGDRMSERYRQELPTLASLTKCDQVLIGQCELMRSMTEAKGGGRMLESATILEEGLAAIQGTLDERAGILLST